MSELNERQQRAFAAIMAQIAMPPWEERREVCSQVRFNDSICFECGSAIDGRYDCTCTKDE